MQALDIDRLIDLAKQSPEEFESIKLILISHAIQSCEKPARGHQLQAAISLFHSDPKGWGADFLRQTIEAMSGDSVLFGDPAGLSKRIQATVAQS